MMPDRRGLILFAKAPAAGKVKTRLEPALGTDGALSLYRQMLRQQLDLVESFSAASSEIWIEGDPCHEDFTQLHSGIRQQQGRDIGERMALALADVLARFSSAVLIGSDCPDFDADYLESAFFSLEEGVDVVLGPAMDGGYVLIGIKKASKAAVSELFYNIDWGTDQVMIQTRSRLRSLGISWKELQPLRDIDDPADLEYLPGQFSI